MLQTPTAPGNNVWNVTFQNITAFSQGSVVLSGKAPGLPIVNVSLVNVSVTIDRWPNWNYSTNTNPAVYPNIEYDPSTATSPNRVNMTGWQPGVYVEGAIGTVLNNVSVVFNNQNYQSYWGTGKSFVYLMLV